MNDGDVLDEAIGLLKLIAQGECDIADGKVLSQEDFFSSLDCEYDNIRP